MLLASVPHVHEAVTLASKLDYEPTLIVWRVLAIRNLAKYLEAPRDALGFELSYKFVLVLVARLLGVVMLETLRNANSPPMMATATTNTPATSWPAEVPMRK